MSETQTALDAASEEAPPAATSADALRPEALDSEPGTEAPAQPRPWGRRLLIAMALLVAAAIGLGVGVWLARPHYPGDSSPEAGFARDMATHHAQAVAMGLLEYRNGGDEGLRGIGYDIANTQQAQIGMMNAWLREWDLSLTTTETPMAWVEGHEAHLVDGLMPGVATKDEMQQMRTLTGRDLDILFCHLMIDHHIGGIHMVDAILAQSDDTEVTRLAQGMKDAQQYEIDTLEQKLRDLGAA